MTSAKTTSQLNKHAHLQRAPSQNTQINAVCLICEIKTVLTSQKVIHPGLLISIRKEIAITSELIRMNR